MPKAVDLRQALRMTPVELVKHYRSKGHEISWDWWEVWQGAHDRAFTVAKAAQQSVLNAIHQDMTKALEEGLTFRQFSQSLTPRLQKLGWWGKAKIDGEEVTLGTPRRLHTIFRVNAMTARQRARHQQQVENTESRPYWMYDAVLDRRTRESHAAMNGKVFRADDPIWESFYPPNGWMCRCTVRALTEKQVQSRGLEVLDSASMSVDEVIQRVGVDKRTGEIIERPGKRIMLPDPKSPGEMLAFAPDPGWSYNPGMTNDVGLKSKPKSKPGGKSGAGGLNTIKGKSPGTKPPQPNSVDKYVAAGAETRKELEKRPSVKAAMAAEAKDIPEKWSNAFRGELLDSLKKERGAGTIPLQMQASPQAKPLMKKAAERYPAAWIEAANALGMLWARKSQGRAWHYTHTGKDTIEKLGPFGQVKVKKNEGFIVTDQWVGTAIHEFGHRLQKAMPALDQFFRNLHERRTSKANPVTLQSLQPDHKYGPKEITKPDNYIDPYFGSIRQNGPVEVLTMAFQSVLGDVYGDGKWIWKLRQQDNEMLDLTIGLLMRFDP